RGQRRDISPPSTSGYRRAAGSGGPGPGLSRPLFFTWGGGIRSFFCFGWCGGPVARRPGAPLRRTLPSPALPAPLTSPSSSAQYPVALSQTAFTWTVATLLAASALFWRAPLPFAAMIAFILLAYYSIVEQPGAMSVRSFFGVSRIRETETTGGQFRLLQHGTTLHGGQRIREADGRLAAIDPPELLLYYWDGSAIAETFAAVRARVDRPIRFAVIGLGA